MRNRLVARIYFHDEAPRIGSGIRGCTILVGRKWVRVVENATGVRVRFKKDKFADLFHGLI